MRDRIQVSSTQASATCTELAGREIELARREMMYASGGLAPLLIGPPVLLYIFAAEIAKFISDHLDDGSR